ncbi:MAG TPA: sigma-70 family RNA polymerase sigma factor [Myxococcales bacterium]|jgi:RNA polymerase sigma-70 factor (ECF subfamily)|nr:sigma-70 family RNA polymerase sigma factor [Myxococcales bacterium]
MGIDAFLAEVRPELHRYCARMTGSVIDGEDVVQDVLARAAEEAKATGAPPSRPWIFRVAHHRAIDFTRRYERRMSEPLKDLEDGSTPEDAIARREAVALAISRFIELPPLPRACVILKDVLGHSVAEMVSMLDSTEPAVKAALHRGREKLKQLQPLQQAHGEISPALKQYAQLFNARDWSGLQQLLAGDVELDLINKAKLKGRDDVSHYFGRYQALEGWHVRPAWLEGREVLAFFATPEARRPGYFVLLGLAGGQVAAIRDFRYVDYVARDAEMQFE